MPDADTRASAVNIPSSKRRPASALITDLDNTLWDWFEIWHAGFRALLDGLVKKTGIPESTLLPQIKSVHEKHGTAEYAFLIQELPIISERYPNVDVPKEFKEVIDAHKIARHEYTHLYDGVYRTLMSFREAGAVIIAYTESLQFYTARRIRETNLDGVLDSVYSPPDHEKPDSLQLSAVRSKPNRDYDLRLTRHELTPRGALKPDKQILRKIVKDHALNPHETIYVGDSLVKDVSMAQAAGVVDVHAEYGVAHNDERYDLLRKVTHWTPQMVDRESRITAQDVAPTYVLRKSFAELLEHFRPIRQSGDLSHDRPRE